MAYTGINQTSVTARPAVAHAGMISDLRDRWINTHKASAAVDAGRIVFGTALVCSPLNSYDDLATLVGLTVYEGIKEPSLAATRFVAGDDVSVLSRGRGWAALLDDAAPTYGQHVYAYCGATAALQGVVSPTAAADYARVPGAIFTGRIAADSDGDGDCAEIELGSPLGAAFMMNRQAISGTWEGGTVTISTGIRVTAASRATITPSAAITGSTNVGCPAHIIASNVAGEPGTGSVIIRLLGDDGAVDADAAGTFHGSLWD